MEGGLIKDSLHFIYTSTIYVHDQILFKFQNSYFAI